MICENCNKNTATSVITKTINQNTSTIHLCGECAFKIGYSNLLSSFSLNHFEGMPNRQTTKKRCPKCNCVLDEILSYGKIGCAECYSTFKDELLPTIEKIHGKAYHVGKRPRHNNEVEDTQTLLKSLKQRLEQAIKQEEFETAAIIRDKIKMINDKKKGGANDEMV